jgi:hypothetical protein
MLNEGHVDDGNHLFAHLVMNHNVRFVFDPTYPHIYEGAFINTDWKALLGGLNETVLIYASNHLVGFPLYVDSDHAEVLNYSHSRNPPCAPARTHGQIQAPREPPN